MNNAFYFGFFPRFFLFFWVTFEGQSEGLERLQNTHAEEFFHCRVGRLCMQHLPLCTITFRGQWLMSSWEAGCVEEMKNIYIFKKPVWNSLSWWFLGSFFVVVRLHIILTRSAPLFEDMDEKQNTQQPSSLSCKASQSCTFCPGLASDGVKLCLRQLVPTQIRWLLTR